MTSHEIESLREETPAGRRVAAIVLSQLLCEVAQSPHKEELSDLARQRRKLPPLGVVLSEGEGERELESSAILTAVNREARSYGVRPGQSIAEARALVAGLVVREVTRERLNGALARVAEVALGFGATVSLEVPDTVWVETTGVAQLFGGERALAEEIVSRVRELGHGVRVAISEGPHLARAFATWGPINRTATCVVPPSETIERLHELPVRCLPLDAERIDWLSRLGVLDVGDLAKLPRKAVSSRLGKEARRILQLCVGKDPAPLAAYEPPRTLHEETQWEEPVSGLEPLLFVLRGLVSRISARLSGRGEAAQALDLEILHDASIARLRGVPPKRTLHLDLAAPLWRESELERVVRSRLERTELGAPTLGLSLAVPQLTPAHVQQLDLSRVSGGKLSGCRGLEELPVLLAELAADIGSEQVGVLEMVDSHRPEARSVLVPVEGVGASLPKGSNNGSVRSRNGSKLGATSNKQRGLGRSAASRSRSRGAVEQLSLGELPARKACSRFDYATRLLPTPIPFESPVRIGASCVIGPHFYTIEKVRFLHRLEGVEWWTSEPASRDYLRLWLRSSEGGLDALVFVDRPSGRRYVQAIAD